MTLSELISYIKEKFPQEEITSDVFDFKNVKEGKGQVPKYFYRGESMLYQDTKTTLVRLYREWNFGQDEWQEYISIHLHLYRFLREALWGISVVDDKEHKNPSIELAIAGMLQHYGFDTSFLDLTSNIDIAANFASMNKIGEKGRILVIESESLNRVRVNYYFDLTRCQGSRPKKQNSYVLWDQSRQLDLKDDNFLSTHNGQWFDFEIDKESKLNYNNQSLLSTKGDDIVYHITDWWKNSDVKSRFSSSKGINLIENKIKKLNNKSG